MLDFIEGNPVLHTVGETVGYESSVIGKSLHDIPVAPATFPVECLGHIPMMQVHKRPDAVGEKGVNEPVIKGQPFGIGFAGAVREYARP